MFTLKFMADSRYEGNIEGRLTHVIAVHSYQVYTRTNGIITISAIDSEGCGVDFHIAPVRKHHEYEECFVENSKGKTIARYISDLTVDEYLELCKPEKGVNGSAR